jgi:hypothetical protein
LSRPRALAEVVGDHAVLDHQPDALMIGEGVDIRQRIPADGDDVSELARLE